MSRYWDESPEGQAVRRRTPIRRDPIKDGWGDPGYEEEMAWRREYDRGQACHAAWREKRKAEMVEKAERFLASDSWSRVSLGNLDYVAVEGAIYRAVRKLVGPSPLNEHWAASVHRYALRLAMCFRANERYGDVVARVDDDIKYLEFAINNWYNKGFASRQPTPDQMREYGWTEDPPGFWRPPAHVLAVLRKVNVSMDCPDGTHVGTAQLHYRENKDKVVGIGPPPTITTAAGVVVRNGRGQCPHWILGVRRADGQKGLPCGKVEPGETPEQAAVRECLEETGQRVTIIGPAYVARVGRHKRWTDVHTFPARLIDDSPLIAGADWWTGHQLACGFEGRYNDAAIAHCTKWVGQ